MQYRLWGNQDVFVSRDVGVAPTKLVTNLGRVSVCVRELNHQEAMLIAGSIPH